MSLAYTHRQYSVCLTPYYLVIAHALAKSSFTSCVGIITALLITTEIDPFLPELCDAVLSIQLLLITSKKRSKKLGYFGRAHREKMHHQEE